MRVRKKLDFPHLALYTLLLLASLFLFFVGDNGEPISLLLSFAAIESGVGLLPSLIVGVLPVVCSRNILLILLYFGQAALIGLGWLIHSRIHNERMQKARLLPMLALSLALGTFVAVAPFTPYTLPFRHAFTDNVLVQKIVIAALLFLLSAVFSVGMRALLKKLLQCRLRNDEIVFTVASLLLVGVGLCKLFGFNAYLGMAIFVLLLFSYAMKDASACVCSFCLSLPPLLVFQYSPIPFFLYGIAVTLVVKNGRFAAVCGALTVFFSYGYFQGLYTQGGVAFLWDLSAVILPCLLFLILPAPIMRALENKIVFYRERHLTRIAINRNRAAVGEKLFELSSVFREIQTAFSLLGNAENNEGAKSYMRDCIAEELCKNCPKFAECEQKELSPAFDTLMEIGCRKGKVNLIDIPRTLSEACAYQSDLLYTLNKQLGEYKRYVTETENAASGRELLANQAQGVSEILKNLALEQSEPLRLYTEKERALNIALLEAGIICTEVLVYGEEERLTLSLVTFGRVDVKKIAAVSSHVLETRMMISERIPLSGEKFCCILHKKPILDAAFGATNLTKAGETASGDTHSVIKIDERRFIVALSDGMGSGEYARNVSESTLSLLESFYRAKMPPELILSTINRLLAFGKEETFACVDVAVIDLDCGRADVVKIGSPAAFILSGNTVRILESSSLPLGILDALHPDTATYELMENDLLLFVSDGIADAFGSPSDLYDVLRTIPTGNPQELTDCLTESALRAYGGVAKDDMTAVAVRLYKAS